MSIRLACSDADIFACHGVMRELRPHLDARAFFTSLFSAPGKALYRAKTAGRNQVCVRQAPVAQAGP